MNNGLKRECCGAGCVSLYEVEVGIVICISKKSSLLYHNKSECFVTRP